ncbi:Protein of unknown function [Cotesia congregata]|uniref:Uncharacterized protein n=1 Tax=Cotesia congregata TaxID=51543 RepID=A0A8J2HGM1_COTCN|nr:Protein of unknown function [Cotesia congregata]
MIRRNKAVIRNPKTAKKLLRQFDLHSNLDSGLYQLQVLLHEQFKTRANLGRRQRLNREFSLTKTNRRYTRSRMNLENVRLPGRVRVTCLCYPLAILRTEERLTTF